MGKMDRFGECTLNAYACTLYNYRWRLDDFKLCWLKVVDKCEEYVYLENPMVDILPIL